MNKDTSQLKQKIIDGQKRRKELKKKKEVNPSFQKFQECAPLLGFDPAKFNQNNVPFNYTGWEELCTDIQKYHNEVMNIFKTIQVPEPVKKPMFYKFKSDGGDENGKTSTTMIRIQNIGSPHIALIECAINGDDKSIKEVTTLLQFGKNIPLVYLYSEHPNTNNSERKLKMRTVNVPSIDMLKIRVMLLFKNGFGITFRE
jgi:hypothetical protein